MNAGAEVPVSDAPDIPEGLVYKVDDEMTLSNWGKLVWNECKEELLSQDLLPFARLEYRSSFVADYQQIRDKGERVRLQEDLAKVSYLFSASQGNTNALSSLDYKRYQGSNRIDHFRVNLSLRVSCEAVDGKLIMRYYGTHAHVEGNEGLRS